MYEIKADRFYLIGNNLALDFVNSIMFDATAENLAAWAVAVGLISEGDAEQSRPKWRPDQLERISTFRQRLRGMVESLLENGGISELDIDAVNRILRQGGRFVELQRTADSFVKRVEIDATDAANLLVPIAESFVDLLCYGNLDYLRQCENPDCILYFYDTTKNHRRRWCSMAACGNRAKASKFYKRKKERVVA